MMKHLDNNVTRRSDEGISPTLKTRIFNISRDCNLFDFIMRLNNQRSDCY